MPGIAVKIELDNETRSKLQSIVNSRRSHQGLAFRAQVILLAEQGLSNKEIARRLNTNEQRVGRWRNRFASEDLDGLKERPGRGAPPTYDADLRLKVIQEACQPPEETTHWTVRDLQSHVNQKYSVSVSHMFVHRLLESLDLKPHQYQMWLNSNDPDFEAKKCNIVGLYLNPPDNALVLSVDEKSGIQALGRKHPSKPMKQGQPEKREFEYIRHGTKSLIAALAVHEGEVMGKCYDRRSNAEFLDFLQELVRAYPEKDLYVIVDNLNIHKHENVKVWLTENPRVRFFFTPTHASWLNQIELWFSILARKVLKRGIFNSKEELVARIMSFIRKYNETAKPFRWTYTGQPLTI